ncbi:MAG: DinB family protein, partial [Bacteroidetes bacterium]
YAGYIATVAGDDVAAVLREQPARLQALLGGLDEDGAAYRYAPEKWSVKEVVGHLTDAERVLAYRLLRVARGDATPLPGFDEDAYVQAAGFDRFPLTTLLDGFAATRAATLALVDTLTGEVWERSGVANGSPITARALAHILAGHVRHHLLVLRERYGLAPETRRGGHGNGPARYSPSSDRTPENEGG